MRNLSTITMNALIVFIDTYQTLIKKPLRFEGSIARFGAIIRSNSSD